MITITETVHRSKMRLEPTYVRYHQRELEPVHFQAVRFQAKRSRRFQPLVAGVYGTNLSPRDRMRHEYRWLGTKCPTARYQTIG